MTAFPQGADKDNLGSPVVVVRVDPATLQLPAERAVWAPQGILAYSKICTHAACAISLFRSPLSPTTQSRGPALICPCHYSTFDVLDGGSVEFGPAGRPLPQLPLQIDASGALTAARSDVRARRPVLVGRQQVSKPSSRAGGAAVDAVSFIDERLGAARGLQVPDGLRVPRPLELPARRDRAVLVRRADRHRHVPGAVLRPEHRRERLPRRLRRTAGPGSLGGLRLDAAPLLQRLRWPVDAPDPPLGRARVRRGDHAAPAADHLHRRVSQAPRHQLLHRADAADPRDPRGVRRLLAARRPALRDGPRDRLGRRDVTAADRRPARVRALGRPLPRRDARSSHGSTSRTYSSSLRCSPVCSPCTWRSS